MPIHKVAGGWQWGSHGHVYPDRAGAERQAAAAHAHGYTGDRRIAGDMSRGDIAGLLSGLFKFFTEEAREPEHQAQDAKLPKSEVDYSRGKGADRCANCRHFLGNNTCEIVEGTISPEGWCKKFSPEAAQDAEPVKAAGTILQAPDGSILFVRRSDKGDHAGEWCLPGGALEGEETPSEAARRETQEEVGYDPKELEEVHQGFNIFVDSALDENVDYTTFYHRLADRFEPKLNDEHTEYRWSMVGEAPEPMHPGLTALFANDAAQTELSKRIEREYDRGHTAPGQAAAIAYSELGEDIAEWQEGDHPRAPNGQFGHGASVKLSDMKKTGKQMGSNPGGVYTDKAGKQYYIKQGKTADHVRNELRAASLYRLAGGKTLDYHPVEGANAVATQMTKLDKSNARSFSPAELKKAQEDFAIHAWLANWDAAGLEYDNQAIIGGEPASIDLGGALKYRAQGGPKGSAFGNQALEWNSLRDAKLNPQNAKLFGSMSQEQLQRSAARIAAIPDDEIRQRTEDEPELGEKLIARKKDIVRRAGLIAQDEGLALDKNTVRNYDKVGRLHTDHVNISMATVNPYRGREIPNYRELGLEPERIYHLLRDPDELKKAAPTFNGVPLLIKHQPVTAEDHDRAKTVGSLGTEAYYEHPYLRNKLSVWDQEGIDGIEDKSKHELSSGYHYRADMTPGYYEGQRYDGVMRDIVGNHVALVKEGRAGRNVVVGDAALEFTTTEEAVMAIKSRTALMLHGSLLTFLPKVTQPAQIALDAALQDITAANFVAKRPDLKKRLAAVKQNIATDADLEGMHSFIDRLDKPPVEAKDDTIVEPNSAVPAGLEGEDEDDEHKELKDFLKTKGMDEEAIKGAMDAIKIGRDRKSAYDTKHSARDAETPEQKAEREKKEKEAEDKRAGAMDAAIKAAVKSAETAAVKRLNAVREAERAVKPWVGELNMAFDSADDVYAAALKQLGVDTADVPAAAYPHILKAQPKPGQRQGSSSSSTPSIALDSAGVKNFHSRIPGAARVEVLG